MPQTQSSPPKPILVAGATASGKSALAIRLARQSGGVIINADSMQVYADLRLLTARPTPAEEGDVPHRLYGHIAATDAYSTGRYVDDVGMVLAELEQQGRQAIIVGGTGLYFSALLQGLSPVPAIPAEVRQRWRAMAETEPVAALHAALSDRDPEMAARLNERDGQRIVRALEVLAATGRSLADWQRLPGTPILREADTVRLVVTRARDDLYRRCEARLDAMLADGALDEVRALAALALPAQLPVMRALGVRPLIAHLRGETTLDAGIAQAKLATRHYIKRQETWLKRQMMSWRTLDAQQTESYRIP